MYFEYGEAELSYLRQKDKRMCEVIDRVGHVERTVDTDLFSSVVHHIIGQQISMKAQATEDAIRALSSLKGIGVWTAEMILLFCMQRPDIFSYDDLAIQRGLRMVYRHRAIDRKLFEKYRRRFSPCCSVASLYLWAVSGGAIPELSDPRPKNKK